MTIKRFSQLLAVVIAGLLPLYYVRFTLLSLPTNLIEVLVLILLVTTVWSARKLKLPNWQPIMLILVGLILATAVAVDRQAAFGIVKGWFAVPLVYYTCLATLFSATERTLFIKPLLASTVLVAVYAILQWFGLIGLLAHQGAAAQQYLDQGRAIAFFESPNFLAMYLVPLTLLTGGYLFLTKQTRLMWWLILPVIAIGLSQSRGGLLAIVAGLAWLAVRSSTKPGVSPRPRWVALVAVGLGFLLAFVRSTDDSQRFYIWHSAWQLISHHWLIGIGPGQFQSYFANLNDGSVLFMNTLPYALHPHNIFLNFWLSTGLAGLIGLAWLLVRLFKFATRNRSPLALAATAGLVAILVHGLFDSTYFKNDLAIIFWLLVFLVGNQYGETDG